MQSDSYHHYSRWLHWAIAFLIVFMVFLGWRLGDHDSLRLSRINLHKSVGILILMLSVVRIAVRLTYKAPPEVPMPRWQAFSAKALHMSFYIVMIAMPVTGWAMVSTSVRPIPFFGLFSLPHLPVPQSVGVHDAFEAGHDLIAKLLFFGMIPLHVLAALKHHFVEKDATLSHMVPGLTPGRKANWRWLVPVGVLALATGLGTLVYRGVPDNAATAPIPPFPVSSDETSVSSTDTSVNQASGSPTAEREMAVPRWEVTKAGTRIAFGTTFQGEAITGIFKDYSADIRFDPDNLPASSVKVTIDLASVSSGDDDRDTTLRSASFFDTLNTPKAVFEASAFSRKDETHFVAHGRLRIHGVAKPVELPFVLKIRDARASMSAATSIDRTLFSIGSGDYASTDTTPAKVSVDILLTANSAKASR